MRSLLTIFLLFISITLFAQKQLFKINSDLDQFGMMKNESIIKQNHMWHDGNQKKYNIAFFTRGVNEDIIKYDLYNGTFEIWGHGKNHLSFMGPIHRTYSGEKLNILRSRILDGYKLFQSEIVSKRDNYEHLDIKIDENIYLSFYLNRDVEEFAFWIDYVKYKMDQQSFEVFLNALIKYFN
jgi:hypothetical protein